MKRRRDDAGQMVEDLCENAAIEESKWKERLKLVERWASVGDKELEGEAAKVAAERYGDNGVCFYPEVEAVAGLVKYSTRTVDEEEFLESVEQCNKAVNKAKEPLKEALDEAKTAKNTEVLRKIGSEFNILSKSQKRIQALDKLVGTRIHNANKRLAQYRSATRVRDISGKKLENTPPTSLGHLKILDFYRLTDAGRYSFGRQLSGPQHYTDIRRNVAILSVVNDKGEQVYNGYAISGDGTPGCQGCTPPQKHFTSICCEDGLGEAYDRQHDAEFKLISYFVETLVSASVELSVYTSTITLWSKKPLCKSCTAVFKEQLSDVLPKGAANTGLL